ncbi:hypothetical protein AAVH_26687 [Aphelenchoides avenae]|nr:hypothetical protein AAVH_26687 [Aphelenchus avenae]
MRPVICSTRSAFQLVDREKDDTLPQLEALARVYFPPLSIAEANALKAFFQELDGQRICKRAIPCGADYECIVHRLLQGIGDSAFSTPGLNMDSFVCIYTGFSMAILVKEVM